MKPLSDIKDSFIDKLILLRTFYMSSLIENELANNLITTLSSSGIEVNSKYKNEDNKFVFGQGSGYLNTKVEINECFYMITQSNTRTRMLINLLTINLCSAFESFLFELHEYYMRNCPEYIINSQKNVKLQEVFKYNSIEEIKEDLIVREILDFGHLSLEKQVLLIAKNFKVDFNFKSENKIAKRIFIKRNCIVHNQGIVNKELFELFNEEQKNRNIVGETINTSEFEFSEEIHLLNLMGTRIITTIQQVQ